MQFEEFRKSLGDDIPSAALSPYLQSLWHDAKGDWEEAHNIIQYLETPLGSWIHAYLHRKEGDIGNADYWYRDAGKKRPAVSLEKEWEEMVKELLK